MAYECDRCRSWTPNTEKHNCVYDELETLRTKLAIATEALEWIDKPDHYEPDNYTQTACFQHRAYEALKQIRGDDREGG